MAKKNDAQQKDLTIENETIPLKNGKSITISVLNFACDNNTDKALRVLEGNGECRFYRSSRLGTLEKTDTGLQADVSGFEKEITGKRYELCEVATKEVLMTGKIVNKAAAAEKIVDLKTANSK